MLVAYAFPLFMVPAMYCGAVFGFKRDRGDKEALNASLDAHFDKYPEFHGMVVYPEGTRNIKEHSLPLKRGMLRYAHTRKLAVQVIVTAKKERVFSSHLLCAERGKALPMYVSKVIYAEQYPDFEDFYNAIRAKWDDSWSAANNVTEAEAEALPDYVPRECPIKCQARHDIATVSAVVCSVLAVAVAYRVFSYGLEY
jgi:hypothetical protein